MKKAIRCCISCVLPCGALDVVRIVHISGRVDELSGTVTAGEFLKGYPNHILKRPSSSASHDGCVVAKIVVVPPEAELQKGKIYFLIPAPPEKGGAARQRKKRRDTSAHLVDTAKNTVVSDRYLSEILSEKVSPLQRDGRRGRVAVWRPHLESISETPTDIYV